MELPGIIPRSITNSQIHENWPPLENRNVSLRNLPYEPTFIDESIPSRNSGPQQLPIQNVALPVEQPLSTNTIDVQTTVTGSQEAGQPSSTANPLIPTQPFTLENVLADNPNIMPPPYDKRKSNTQQNLMNTSISLDNAPGYVSIRYIPQRVPQPVPQQNLTSMSSDISPIQGMAGFNNLYGIPSSSPVTQPPATTGGQGITTNSRILRRRDSVPIYSLSGEELVGSRQFINPSTNENYPFVIRNNNQEVSVISGPMQQNDNIIRMQPYRGGGPILDSESSSVSNSQIPIGNSPIQGFYSSDNNDYGSFVRQYATSPQSLNLFPNESINSQSLQLISPENNSGVLNNTNTLQPMVDRSMFNQLNNIRFPTQGNYMLTPPDLQNISSNYFTRSPPQSMNNIQSRTNQLLTLARQQNIQPEQNAAVDERIGQIWGSGNSFKTGLNLVGNQTTQSGTGASNTLVRKKVNLTRREFNSLSPYERVLRSGYLKFLNNPRVTQ